jgi:hypothetical protein
MSKLHAQMALLGRIDEVVCSGDLKDETVEMIETFLPGTTGVGQQGWYTELQNFLQSPQLVPRDAQQRQLRRSAPVTLPTYVEALDELTTGPAEEEKPASPATQARALYAAAILSRAERIERRPLPPPRDMPPSTELPDPLDVLVPTEIRTTRESSSPAADIDTPTTAEGLKDALRDVRNPAEYQTTTAAIADSNEVDPDLADVLSRPVVCTGAIRKIDGKFCTVLTTSWKSPFTLGQIKRIVDPLNWPDLCDFFVSMTEQSVRQPDSSLGWSRVLESVSGDPKQWQMQTALRYWKAVTRNQQNKETGIYVNYDLDEPPRVGDCKLLEVDAGYIWATPETPGDDNSTVYLRTCKQVRIRGVSLTATAALACGFGWGDAMSQMFTDPPQNTKRTWTPSVLKAKPADTGQSAQKQPGEETEQQIEEAAEDVELLKGWRGAIIKAMQTQMNAGIDRAKSLGTDFAVRWSDGDGFGLADVNEFGTRAGKEMTEYATGMFKAAGAALQPPPKKAGSKKGKN